MAEDGHTFLKGPAPGHLCWCNVLQKKKIITPNYIATLLETNVGSFDNR
jgi:hypothetical protein